MMAQYRGRQLILKVGYVHQMNHVLLRLKTEICKNVGTLEGILESILANLIV